LIESVGPPTRGEYINEATFLTSDDWEKDLRVNELSIDDVVAIALSTDGLEYKILQNVRLSDPYLPFFEDAFAWLLRDDVTTEAVTSFIDKLEDESGDDKTLLLARRLPRVSGDVTGHKAPSAAEPVEAGQQRSVPRSVAEEPD
jgi:hypothetical protein